MQAAHGGRLPEPGSEAEADEVVAKASGILFLCSGAAAAGFCYCWLLARVTFAAVVSHKSTVRLCRRAHLEVQQALLRPTIHAVPNAR